MPDLIQNYIVGGLGLLAAVFALTKGLHWLDRQAEKATKTPPAAE